MVGKSPKKKGEPSYEVTDLNVILFSSIRRPVIPVPDLHVNFMSFDYCLSRVKLAYSNQFI
jgi:hypothetical protein